MPKNKVLIIEDRKSFAGMVQKIIEDAHGYEVDISMQKATSSLLYLLVQTILQLKKICGLRVLPISIKKHLKLLKTKKIFTCLLSTVI